LDQNEPIHHPAGEISRPGAQFVWSAQLVSVILQKIIYVSESLSVTRRSRKRRSLNQRQVYGLWST